MFKDTKNYTKDCLKLAIFIILLEKCTFLRLLRETITIIRIKNCKLSEKNIHTICDKKIFLLPLFQIFKIKKSNFHFLGKIGQNCTLWVVSPLKGLGQRPTGVLGADSLSRCFQYLYKALILIGLRFLGPVQLFRIRSNQI